MGSSLHGVVRLALYLGLTMALLPVQALLVAVRSPLRDRLPRWYHARVLRIVGMSVEVIGTPSPDSPTLFVANHSSYWDIEVLGSMLTASFVAKTEVGGWPLFGLLARLQRTVFVERRRGAAGRSRNEIARSGPGGTAVAPPKVSHHQRRSRQPGNHSQGAHVGRHHHVAVARLPTRHSVSVDGVHLHIDREQVVAAFGAVGRDLLGKQPR